ncbi:DNA-packaging protein [Stutzerimonas nitrititolerans]|uniref:DNA-packaging protein n=1 Tax=Stutzerimonas nitrititolerans TaxID=2482751 RepID=UPI0028A9DF4B|nr:DNA-packaging protein [Stutzerimonas nitrititolerans]
MTWTDLIRKLLPAALVVILFASWYLLIERWKSEAYGRGYAAASDKGELALAKLRSEHQALELDRAQDDAANAKAAAKRLQDEQARNDQLAADLAEQQRIHRQNTDRLSEEIARVNDLYREALDAQPKPLPACVFTAGFVRVWDEATGAAMPASSDPGRAAAQGTDARAAEQLDTGLSQSDVLTHHVRYAEQCRNTAAQLDRLIDAVEGN